jgi:hypothetical protein
MGSFGQQQKEVEEAMIEDGHGVGIGVGTSRSRRREQESAYEMTEWALRACQSQRGFLIMHLNSDEFIN